MSDLVVASLNTRGIPIIGSRLAERYAAIAEVFEASEVDVVNFQEVLTYYHLRQLVRWMPSYRVSCRRSAVGPAGGLVTFSRGPVESTRYVRFPALSPGLGTLTRLKASHVARESSLYRDFISSTQLTDAFAGACPPTFRTEYLPPGRTSQCIDFVLVTGAVDVESADLMFTDNSPLVSDHLGLRVRLRVSA